MFAAITFIIDGILGKRPKGAKRSKDWSNVRKQFLEKHGSCAVCGSKTNLEVHHKQPFHLAPELELEESNLITLCERKKYGINCHLLIGHIGNYKKANSEVEIDAETWNKKLTTLDN
jgi:hypothetical protein